MMVTIRVWLSVCNTNYKLIMPSVTYSTLLVILSLFTGNLGATIGLPGPPAVPPASTRKQSTSSTYIKTTKEPEELLTRSARMSLQCGHQRAWPYLSMLFSTSVYNTFYNDIFYILVL